MGLVKHPGYRKFSVERDVESFCGWDLLLRMVSLVDRLTEEPAKYRALISALFLTGCRVHEVIPYRGIYGLRYRHFDLDSDPGYILVSGVPILKRYTSRERVRKWKCVGHCKMHWSREPTEEERRRHQIVEYLGYVTEREIRTRSFPISKNTPLSPILMDYVRPKLGSDEYLFRGVFYSNVYTLCRRLSEELGVVVRPHWFRAQRASQLAAEVGADRDELKAYFSWRSDEDAERYAKMGIKGLLRRGIG